MGMVIFPPATEELDKVNSAIENKLENIIKPFLPRYILQSPDIEWLIKYAIKLGNLA
ncbi:hypothetical protein [Vibrio harveyi]|uniref:hypothetical protein n=1 Tax=Vibrio harveyi TaxID=669 RepID=UPI003BB6667B